MQRGIILVSHSEIGSENRLLVNKLAAKFKSFSFCLVKNFIQSKPIRTQIHQELKNSVIEIEIKKPKSYKHAVKQGMRALSKGNDLKYACHTELKNYECSAWISDAISSIESNESIAVGILETKPIYRHFDRISFDLSEIRAY